MVAKSLFVGRLNPFPGLRPRLGFKTPRLLNRLVSFFPRHDSLIVALANTKHCKRRPKLPLQVLMNQEGLRGGFYAAEKSRNHEMRARMDEWSLGSPEAPVAEGAGCVVSRAINPSVRSCDPQHSLLWLGLDEVYLMLSGPWGLKLRFRVGFWGKGGPEESRPATQCINWHQQRSRNTEN